MEEKDIDFTSSDLTWKNAENETNNQPTNKNITYKQNISNKKTNLLILAVSIIALIVLGIFLASRQARISNEENYGVNLRLLLANMVVQEFHFVQMTNTYIEVWENAIKSRRDFNGEIAAQYEKFKYRIQTLEEKDHEIDSLMSSLKNPPEKYKQSYTLLLELYGVYKDFYSLARFPSGSYMTYSAKVREIKNEWDKIYNKIMVVRPD